MSARVVFSTYGFWNLDLTPIPHTCVSVDILEALALDYAIAFYPLILLVIYYVLIQVNTFNFMCRPFHRCADHLRKQLDVRNSIVEAFSTFFLLSYVKLLGVSFDLLVPHMRTM